MTSQTRFMAKLMVGILCFWLASLANQALALTFYTGPDVDMVGNLYKIQVRPKDTIHVLARKNNVGIDELADANPHISKYWLKKGQTLTVPSQFILPSGARTGIVINLAEKRLYFYHPNANKVTTYPITIGREGWLTPVTNTSIIEKRTNPTWFVPDSVWEYNKEKGRILPRTIPPGPENPLGKHAMRLGIWDVLIHGTNRPKNIGIRASSGCIRLHPQDIEELYSMVPVGTPVRIVDEPYKVSYFDGNIFVESHMAQKELWKSSTKRRQALYKAVKSSVPKGEYAEVWDIISKIANMQVGMPISVFE